MSSRAARRVESSRVESSRLPASRVVSQTSCVAQHISLSLSRALLAFSLTLRQLCEFALLLCLSRSPLAARTLSTFVSASLCSCSETRLAAAVHQLRPTRARRCRARRSRTIDFVFLKLSLRAFGRRANEHRFRLNSPTRSASCGRLAIGSSQPAAFELEAAAAVWLCSVGRAQSDCLPACLCAKKSSARSKQATN